MVISQTHLRQESPRHDFEKNPTKLPRTQLPGSPLCLGSLLPPTLTRNFRVSLRETTCWWPRKKTNTSKQAKQTKKTRQSMPPLADTFRRQSLSLYPTLSIGSPFLFLLHLDSSALPFSQLSLFLSSNP